MLAALKGNILIVNALLDKNADYKLKDEVWISVIIFFIFNEYDTGWKLCTIARNSLEKSSFSHQTVSREKTTREALTRRTK